MAADRFHTILRRANDRDELSVTIPFSFVGVRYFHPVTGNRAWYEKHIPFIVMAHTPTCLADMAYLDLRFHHSPNLWYRLVVASLWEGGNNKSRYYHNCQHRRCAGVVPAFEIADTRCEEKPKKTQDIIADSSGATMVMLGGGIHHNRDTSSGGESPASTPSGLKVNGRKRAHNRIYS
jgi:hypothetical protein